MASMENKEHIEGYSREDRKVDREGREANKWRG